MRNRDQISISFKADLQSKNRQKSKTAGRSWFCRSEKRFGIQTFLTEQQPEKLRYYPDLELNLRIRCIKVFYVFELLTNFFLVFFFVSDVLSLYSYATERTSLDAPLHILSNILLHIDSSFSNYLTDVMYITVVFIFYLVCHVYVAQFSLVNSRLTKVKERLSAGGGGGGRSYHLFFRVVSVYRVSHAHLTVFILQFNQNVVSKFFSSYIYLILPYRAYSDTVKYFQLSTQKSYSLIITFLIIQVTNWFFLTLMTSFVAKVNTKISCSGRDLAAIFAGKGFLATGGGKQHNWAHRFESIWSRETLKLATYFEMIWRSEKELAFTAGQHKTMNWKFILDVSWCLKIPPFYYFHFLFFIKC